MNNFLRKSKFCGLVILCFTMANVAAVEIRGLQTGMWTLADSPYLVQGDVLIPPGQTLVIEPGVVVQFAGYYKLKVAGTLYAVGTDTRRIRFTSVNDPEFAAGVVPAQTASNQDWWGIEFTTPRSNASKMDYCEIFYCNQAIISNLANPDLLNLKISKCNTENLIVNGTAIPIRSDVQVDYNQVSALEILEPLLPVVTDTPAPVMPTTPAIDPANQLEILNRAEFSFGELTVLSASKKVQRITEAPAAIYVITEEDIKYSGAITIPDLLRMVPGVDVMQITASDIVVNARGYNEETANKMLVLIDGRTVYSEFYGIILWNCFPITLEEIKRIEVIRGPGSSLYGANAFSGVINIFTKSPAELQGTQVVVTGGEGDTYLTSVIHAGGGKQLKYKTALGFDRANHWKNTDQPSRDVKKLNAVLQYDLTSGSQLVLEGAFNKNFSEYFTGMGRLLTDGDVGHVRLNYTQRNFFLRMFWYHLNGEFTNELTRQISNLQTTTVDLESQYNFALTEKHALAVGGNLRQNFFKGDLFSKTGDLKLGSLYLQDEYKPGKSLSLTLGLRYDKQEIVADQITPRASIIFSPIKDRYLRFSYSNAFRNPSFVESYLAQEIDLTAQAASQLPPGLPNLPSHSVLMGVQGNPALRPEKIRAYEIGYQSYLTSWLQLKTDLFYNELSDFIRFNTVSYQDLGRVIEGMVGFYPGPIYLPKTTSFLNAGKSHGFGGEISLDYLVGHWLKGSVNYSYQNLKWAEDDPQTSENEKNQVVLSSPQHKINTSFKFFFGNGFSLNLMSHYVSATEKRESWAFGKVDPYVLINTRLGYRFNQDKNEISLAIFNLLNHAHYEYPGFDQSGLPTAGHQLGSRITAAFFSHRF